VPPPRPSGADSQVEGPFVYAVRRLDFAGGEWWRRTGRNLDGFCTQSEADESECLPPDPAAGYLADGEGGIDNAFGLAVLENDGLPGGPLALDAPYRSGVGVPLMVLRGWNGENDDPRVELGFLTSVRIVPGAGAAGADGGLVDAGAAPPGAGDWRVGDVAHPGAGGLGDDDRPEVRARNGYVFNRQLVADFPPAPFDIAGMRLTDVRVTARIDPSDVLLRDVTVTGRWARQHVVEQLDSLCYGPDERAWMTSLLDQAVDVRTVPGTGGDGVECDAWSVGLSFVAVQVELGEPEADARPRLPLPSLCHAD
jgi:hypothetical protein